MKFIKELIANKSWSGKSEELDKNDLLKDLEEGNLPAPLAERTSEKQSQDWDEFDNPEFADLHPDAQQSAADTLDDVSAAVMDEEKSKAWLEDFDALDDADDDDWLSDDDDEDDDDWDLGPASTFNDAAPAGEPTPIATRPRTERTVSVVRAVSVPPPANENFAQDHVPGATQDDTDILDETYSDEIQAAAIEAALSNKELSEDERAALVAEIHEAVTSVGRIRTEEELGRQAAAREQLGLGADAAPNSRILDETNSILNEDKGARRRQAIALLKNVAAATKTDPVLQNLGNNDETDMRAAEDSYREDLASFVGEERDPSLIRRVQSKSPEPQDDALAPAAEADPFSNAEPPKWAQDAVAHETVEASDDTAAETAKRVTSQNRVDNLRAALMSQPRADQGTTDEGYVDETDNLPTSAAPADDTHATLQDTVEPQDNDEPLVDISDALSGLTDGFGAGTEMDDAPAAMAATPAAATPAPLGRAGRQAGRAKTRLLGFQSAAGPEADLFNKPAAEAPTPQAGPDMFPLGWIVVVDGPGRGASFALTNGVCQIGRSAEQSVPLAFGDNSISRENHAAIAYDDEQNMFFLGHGGKSNLVRLNGKPVLSTEELSNGDQIRLGETTLKFVALCGGDFSWEKVEGEDNGRAAIA